MVVGVNWLTYQECRRAVLENKLIGFTDDSTLMAVVQSPGVRVAVAESLIRDLGRVSEWCDLWGIKLNASKAKTVIVSRSRTMHPQSPPLTTGGTVLKESDDLVMLGVTFYSKMTFEKHLRSVSRAASQRLGILVKSWRVLHERIVLSCQFWSTVLQSGARLPIHTSNYWTVQSVVLGFELGVCLGVTLLIVDPRQSCVYFIRSGVTRYTLLMVLYMDHMWQCGLHPVLWPPIGGALVHRLAAEPRSTAGLLFPSRCPSGTILLTLYSMVWDWLVSRAGPMLFNWPKLLYPYYSLILFYSLEQIQEETEVLDKC